MKAIEKIQKLKTKYQFDIENTDWNTLTLSWNDRSVECKSVTQSLNAIQHLIKKGELDKNE